ncbi:MAG: hypothetical protein M0Z77_08085 [Thermoplasmatales archaeon]|nr:hypothetical protein [Thermoplasmatales archaeon]
MTDEGNKPATEKQIKFLAQLIREDINVSLEFSTKWATDYVGYIKAIKDGRAYLESESGKMSPKYWVNSVLFTMRPTIIYGAQGQGKSFLCSWSILRAIVVNPDWDFYTNLPFFWFDYPEELPDAILPNVYLVRNMEEMLKGIIRSRRAGRYPAIILDEMDATVDSYSWQSEESQSWRIFTQFQRHFYVKGPILVYHYAKHIPAYLRVGGMGRVVLLEYHNGRRYILAEFTRPWDLVIEGFTPPYASHGSYPFEINVDMRYLYRKLEGVNPLKVLDKMEEALPESIITDEKVEKRFRKIEEAKAREERDKKVVSLSETGMSQTKIAEMLRMSKRDVSQVLRENNINTNGTDGNDPGTTEGSDADKEN